MARCDETWGNEKKTKLPSCVPARYVLFRELLAAIQEESGRDDDERGEPADSAGGSGRAGSSIGGHSHRDKGGASSSSPSDDSDSDDFDDSDDDVEAEVHDAPFVVVDHDNAYQCKLAADDATRDDDAARRRRRRHRKARRRAARASADPAESSSLRASTSSRASSHDEEVARSPITTASFSSSCESSPVRSLSRGSLFSNQSGRGRAGSGGSFASLMVLRVV